MSATAGPISAAMGAGGGTGVGAGNFTSGLAPVTTPKMGQVTNGDLSNPASIANLVQGYQNQANNANSQRYGQALGVMGQAQDSTNSLYGAAQGTVGAMGQQALSRIGLNLQQQLGQQSQDAVSRGLGNTTIADTMQYMPQREAADATLGVNQAVAQMQQNLDTQQASSQTGYGNSIAGLIGSRNDQAPDIGQYAALTQGSFAGNNGQGFPQRSGSVTHNPAPSAPSAPSSPTSQTATGGYMNMADPSQNYGIPGMSGMGGGMGGGGGGGGGGMSGGFGGGAGGGSIAGSLGGGSTGGANYGTNPDGSTWVMPNVGGGSVGLDLGNGAGNGQGGWAQPSGAGVGMPSTQNAGDAATPTPAGAGAISSAVGAPSSAGGAYVGMPGPNGLVMVGANMFGPIWGSPDEIGAEYNG